MAEEPKNQNRPQQQPAPLPPPSFGILLFELRTQAEMQLGLNPFGMEEEGMPEANLELARYTIDLLAILQEKTKGNLTLEEQRYLENSLTELRFRYVQKTDELKNKPAEKTESQQG
ncbi:MAG: DUF1844 domain-containing protein [Acidobacteria bacterium]|nr:DUF1844 domain-containing protein [Acidobacteriota bacterium]